MVKTEENMENCTKNGFLRENGGKNGEIYQKTRCFWAFLVDNVPSSIEIPKRIGCLTDSLVKRRFS